VGFHKLQLLVTANVIRTSLNLFPLLMETMGSSEASVLTKAALRNITEDGTLHSHGRETLKFYMGFELCLPVYQGPPL
jgi:hypothetical protein